MTMEPIQDFAGLICRLRSLKERKRVVVVCPNDPHTEYVITRSLHEGFADFLLVADTPHLLNSEYIRLQYPDHVKVYEATSPDKAAQEAVSLIREGHADVLMKGIINTDNLLRAVLNKEHGILPKGNVLSHITVAQIPMYKKLLFFSDAAVIPRPTLEQFEAMLRYDLEVCRRMGIEAPRVALIHCTEKVNEKFPHTLDYVTLKERAAAGAYGNMYLDGPMDVKTACDAHSGEVKGISSPVVGHADLLIFPNIESGNTFYKTVSLFGDANMAGMLRGTASPVVVPSRADSGNSKYYSLALACVAGYIGVRRILNGLPGRQHLRHRGLTAHLALLHIILQNDLPERDILPRRALKDFLHRIQRHLHRPPYRNRSRSGCPATPREIPPAGA